MVELTIATAAAPARVFYITAHNSSDWETLATALRSDDSCCKEFVGFTICVDESRLRIKRIGWNNESPEFIATREDFAVFAEAFDVAARFSAGTV